MRQRHREALVGSIDAELTRIANQRISECVEAAVDPFLRPDGPPRPATTSALYVARGNALDTFDGRVANLPLAAYLNAADRARSRQMLERRLDDECRQYRRRHFEVYTDMVCDWMQAPDDAYSRRVFGTIESRARESTGQTFPLAFGAATFSTFVLDRTCASWFGIPIWPFLLPFPFIPVLAKNHNINKRTRESEAAVEDLDDEQGRPRQRRRRT